MGHREQRLGTHCPICLLLGSRGPLRQQALKWGIF